MWIIDRFQKFASTRVSRRIRPIIEVKWKKNVGNILDLMGVDPIPKQRLAAFNMKDDASKWYKSQFSKEDPLTTTCLEFIGKFGLHFISSSVRAGKGAHLFVLELG